MMTLQSDQIQNWTRDDFLISTDPSHISLESLNKVLDSNQIFWAKKLPQEELRVMVERSLCFGVYAKQAADGSRPMIGFARLITDSVTVAYLTDVYILRDYQHRGLSSWLIDCVNEWTELMPHMRQLVLVASEGKSEQYYAKKLGVGRLENKSAGSRLLNRIGPGSTLGSIA